MGICPLCLITAAMVVLSDTQESTAMDTYTICDRNMKATFVCNASLILLTNITNQAKESDGRSFESLKRDCMGKYSCDPSRVCHHSNSHPLTVHYTCVDKTYVRSSSCTHTETVTDNFGYIQSPGYPGGSDTEGTCSWIINAPADKAVVILLHDLVTKNRPDKPKPTLVVSGIPCHGKDRDSTYFFGNDNTSSATRCGETGISFMASHKTKEARFWLSFCVLQRDQIYTFPRSALHCPILGHDVIYGQGSKDLLGANSQDSNTEVLVIMLSIISGISAVLLIILIIICVRCRLMQASGAESVYSDPSPSVQPHFEYPSTSGVEKPRPRLADGYFEVSDALPFVPRLEPPTSPTYAEVEHTDGIKKVFHLVPSEKHLREPKSKARPGDGNKKNNKDNQRRNFSASSRGSQTETSGDLGAHKDDNNTRTYVNTTRNVEVQTVSDCMEKGTIPKTTPASSEIALNTQSSSEPDGCSTYEIIGKARAVETCMQVNKRSQTDSRRLSSDVYQRNIPTIESCSKNLQDINDRDKPNYAVGCDGVSPPHCPFATDHTYFVLEKKNKSAYHREKSEPTDMRARSKSLPGRNHDIKKQHKRTACKDTASASGIVRHGIMKFELNST